MNNIFSIKDFKSNTGSKSRLLGIDHGNKNIGIGKECFYMHYSMQIDWNGDVLFCIQDIYGKTRTFGNVNDKSLWDIWETKQMDKYRKLLGSGDRSQTPCNKCDASGIIHGYNHYQEWNQHG